MNQFSQTPKEILKYSGNLTKESADVAGSISVYLMNAMDDLFMSKQTIHEYCELSKALFPTYIKLFDNFTEAQSLAQKPVLTKLVSEGVKSLNASQVALTKCSSNFFEAAGKVASLNNRFAFEFDEKSEYFHQRLEKLKKESGNKKGWFSSLFTSSKADDAKISAQLKAELESIEAFFEVLYTKINAAYQITNAPELTEKLHNEMQIIKQLHIQLALPKPFASIDSSTIQNIIGLTESIKNKCSKLKN